MLACLGYPPDMIEKQVKHSVTRLTYSNVSTATIAFSQLGFKQEVLYLPASTTVIYF